MTTMVTEEDFQAVLDADPTDQTARVIFADWLQERGDERAEGYRKLAETGRNPVTWNFVTWYAERHHPNRLESRPSALPNKWFDLLAGGTSTNGDSKIEGRKYLWWDYRSRREAEDDAARAFAKLT